MAQRKVFIVNKNQVVDEIIDFEYYPGFATCQKNKSINSLHNEIAKKYSNDILEISSKSPNELGKKLSAFNLKIQIDGRMIAVENVFQSSKVFEYGGPYTDLLNVLPIMAKKDKRIKNSGNIIKFKFRTKEYPIYPKNLFYDWIYCRALLNNQDLINELLNYNIFTDIEFNHNKSINCQARSAAIFVFLYRNNLVNKALSNIDDFKKIVFDDYNEIKEEFYIQPKLFK